MEGKDLRGIYPELLSKGSLTRHYTIMKEIFRFYWAFRPKNNRAQVFYNGKGKRKPPVIKQNILNLSPVIAFKIKFETPITQLFA